MRGSSYFDVEGRFFRRYLLLVGQYGVTYSKGIRTYYSYPIESVGYYDMIYGEYSRGQSVAYYYTYALRYYYHVYGGRVRVVHCRIVYSYDAIDLLTLTVLGIRFSVTFSRLFYANVFGSFYYFIGDDVLWLLWSASLVVLS